MTMTERSTWAVIVVFPVVFLVYLAVVIPRVVQQPIEDVSWEVPMIWAMAVCIAGVILGVIASAIGTGARAEIRGQEPAFENGDIRDEDIERYGEYQARHIVGWTGLVIIILAMLDVDTFWIGTTMFLAGGTGAVVAAVFKVRAYRRGF